MHRVELHAPPCHAVAATLEADGATQEGTGQQHHAVPSSPTEVDSYGLTLCASGAYWLTCSRRACKDLHSSYMPELDSELQTCYHVAAQTLQTSDGGISETMATSNEALIARLLEREADLKQAIATLQEELDLIREMLKGQKAKDIVDKIRDEKSASGDEESGPREFSNLSAEDVRNILPLLDVSDMPVWEAAVTILRGVNQPLKTEVLTQVINKMGKPFGGTRPEKSMASHISQKPEYLYQQSGIVYLTEWRDE